MSFIHCQDLYAYHRRKTREVNVGDVGVGGSNPIRLQSMTTTQTMDTDSTVAQTIRMVRAGCEIVRITAPTVEDARNLKNIKQQLLQKGIKVPLVADIHFLPAAAMEAAEHVEKVRVNPGNYVDSKLFKVREYTDQEYQKELERIEERFTPLVLKLKRLGRALRIGTNHGSLSDRIMNRYGDSPEGMVESALEFVRICEKNGFYDIILSMKSSNPKVMIAAYRLLAARMEELGMKYPFHLGVTEAGDGEDGRIKSAIGIGSLLEDGIGDTIRVSLTEEPECEIPVCIQIADLYKERPNKINPGSLHPSLYTDNLYHFSRRATKVLKVGPFRVGGENLVRVVSDFSGHNSSDSLIHVLEEQLGNSKSIAPEILYWTVRTEQDFQNLESCRARIAGETSRLAFHIRFEDSIHLLEKGLTLADSASFRYKEGDDAPTRKSKFVQFAQSAKQRGIPIFLEAGPCSDPEKKARTGNLTPAFNLLNGIEWCESLGMDQLILSFNLPTHTELIYNVRTLVASLREKGKNYPIHLKAQSSPDEDFNRYRIRSSLSIGSLLCDGIGDSVQAGFGVNPKQDLDLVYNILQAAGTRVTKTEFVSCPSCGRTLFDLQTTTERIRSKTGHLKGVKIAIMGCIVNGPGEMADADFGYVGGAPGKINLYVGKECVQKGIPTDVADEKLIELIQTHGKWQDPT
ncbi:MAG: (E)-4-hydroxy-3-methylbut-2-enyl-diphosphate synthase [Elusimicrobia bacterium]|nr:(E)-4-hydroxy-3-methylbut-2-enyl-diphosphate synthase [Elusimicrobiota bacterium]